jgi:hypothetical protein
VEPEPQSLPSRYSSWAPLQAGWPLPYRCLVDLNSSLVLVLSCFTNKQMCLRLLVKPFFHLFSYPNNNFN